jgi:hypothetical protein
MIGLVHVDVAPRLLSGIQKVSIIVVNGHGLWNPSLPGE